MREVMRPDQVEPIQLHILHCPRRGADIAGVAGFDHNYSDTG
jgi:hypothetical protein